MGGCTSMTTIVNVQYNKQSIQVQCKNIADLRQQIISTFKITETFILTSGKKNMRTSSDLFMAPKNTKKQINVIVEVISEAFQPSKAQVKFEKGYGIVFLAKYLVFPTFIFSEGNIKTQSIYIGNEAFELKNYYHPLDVPGLALGKIRKQGRKLELLEFKEETLEDKDKLYIFKENNRYSASKIFNSKSMTGSLVYNEKNYPVAVVAWSDKNEIILLDHLKNSVQFAINFANLPDESMPVNISHLNRSFFSPVFTEVSILFTSNKIITYHPNDYNVNFYPQDKDFTNFSITQTPIGFILALGQEVYNYDIQHLQALQPALTPHRNHTALLHQAFFVILGGVSSKKAECMHLYTLKWNILPDLPNFYEAPASCSVGNSIYMLGGTINGIASDNVIRLEDNTNEWEILRWKLPWTAEAPAAIGIGREIVVFGGVQNDKDKYVVFDNGREITSGYLGSHATFSGLQSGRVNFDMVIHSREGIIFKYDASVKKFFICSIGNYF